MKGARNINEDTAGAPGTGVQIVMVGKLPSKHATVTAEVLARLLAGEHLTGLEAVSCASTTRLAAVVDYLQRDYAWRIERTDRAAGCRDGRVAWVSVYWLAPAAIAAAAVDGAEQWCTAVRVARRALRAKAELAQRAAVRANAAGRRRPQPGQGGLFESEGVAA
jgi:hypothetical protein